MGRIALLLCLLCPAALEASAPLARPQPRRVGLARPLIPAQAGFSGAAPARPRSPGAGAVLRAMRGPRPISPRAAFDGGFERRRASVLAAPSAGVAALSRARLPDARPEPSVPAPTPAKKAFWPKFLADNVVSLFSALTGVATDLVIGLTWPQIAANRSATFALNLPYAMFRDWALKRVGIGPQSSLWRRAAADAAIFAAYWTPIQTAILTISGAPALKMAMVAAVGIGGAAVLGPLYGWGLDFMRKKMGRRRYNNG